MLPPSPYPSSEFDNWAESYDNSVSIDQFPFWGYKRLLNKIVALARAKPGMSILDLGTGTGNLAARFIQSGCEIWCTDFSLPMLEKARQKLPCAHFLLQDLRGDWPQELDHPFDGIVSAYVFHHFDLEEKIRIINRLLHHLAPGGRLVIGDIAFRNAAAQEKVQIAAQDEWEEEFYWHADAAIQSLENLGCKVKYFQISVCAGIFYIST